MDLSKIFLWLDIDGTILDSEKVKELFANEIVEKNVLGGNREFWQIYNSQKESDARIDLDVVIKIWAKKRGLDRKKIVKEIKSLPLENFIYKDFQILSSKLKRFGGFGFFSNGSVWFQKQKIIRIKKFLNFGITEKNLLLSKDKRDLFKRMRGISKGLFSVYADDRLPILKAALEGDFVDLGILIYRERGQPQVSDKKILVIENFSKLMTKLAEAL